MKIGHSIETCEETVFTGPDGEKIFRVAVRCTDCGATATYWQGKEKQILGRPLWLRDGEEEEEEDVGCIPSDAMILSRVRGLVRGEARIVDDDFSLRVVDPLNKITLYEIFQHPRAREALYAALGILLGRDK